MRAWPLSRLGTVCAMACSALSTLAVVLLWAPPLAVCWTGIGPAPEPATSHCVAAKLAAMTPLDRFQYDQPALADVLLVVVPFALTLTLIVAFATALRRRNAR